MIDNMKDKQTTNAQLLEELEQLRLKLAQTQAKLTNKTNTANREIDSIILSGTNSLLNDAAAVWDRLEYLDITELQSSVQSPADTSVYTAELEAVFESVTDPIIIINPQKIIIRANNATISLMGLNPENQTVDELLERFNVKTFGVLTSEVVIDKVLKGKKLKNVLFEFCTQTMEKRSLLVSANPVSFENSILAAVVTWHDITKNIRMEEAFQESEERYRAMGETIPFGTWLCNKNGGLQYASPSYLDLIEMNLEKAREFGWTKRMIPEDVGPMLNRWLLCLKTGEEWEAENRIIGKNGKIFTILSRGRPVRDRFGEITCWVGINLDITQRKEMEEELKKIEWLLNKGCNNTISLSAQPQP